MRVRACVCLCVCVFERVRERERDDLFIIVTWLKQLSTHMDPK